MISTEKQSGVLTAQVLLRTFSLQEDGHVSLFRRIPMDPTTPQETPPVTSIRSGGVTTAKAEMTPGSRERELAGGAMVTPRRPNRRRYGARTGSASRASRSGSRSTSISDEGWVFSCFSCTRSSHIFRSFGTI